MFKEKGMEEDDVLAELENYLLSDSTYSSGHPIASMSTIPDPLGVKVFSKTLEKNAGRLHTFRGSAEIEQEVIQMLGDLLHLERPVGTTTSGGTESNILAMLAARETFSKRSKSPEVVAPKTVHSSIEKAAWLMGVRLVKTEVDEEYRAIPSEIEKQINENTVAIFCTAGTTYLGQVDPITQLGEIAVEKKLQMHVDAAFGGFVLPFLEKVGYTNYEFDFSVEGVTSVSADPHKMGMAPIPAGSILFRNSDVLERITRKVPYLRGASSKQSSLLGTRPAAAILATWAIMRHLGRQGYRGIVEDCMKRTQHALDRIEQNPLLETAIHPVMNILGIKSKERNLDAIVEEMEKRGWRMATSPIPPTMRLVVMPHVTEGAINAFFNDLDAVSTTIPSD